MHARSLAKPSLLAVVAALAAASPHGSAVSWDLLALAPFGTASAEELPPEGPIDTTFTWTSRQEAMPTAGGMEAVTGEAMLVLTAVGAGSILDRLGARCLYAGEQKPDGSEYSIRGRCRFVDADGDQIFETFEETQAGGQGKLVGGTGKFTGITGEHAITSEYFGSPAEGVYQGIGHKKGSYKIVK